MQRISSVWWSVGLIICLTLAGCTKSDSSSPVETLLPAGAAAKLSPELKAFAAELPGDVQGFGYLELGDSLEGYTKSGLFALYRGFYEDLREMTKRRYGLDIRNLKGAGIILYQGEPLLAIVAGAHTKTSTLSSEVMLAGLGRLTVLGEPKAVTALLASAKQGKRLHQTKPAWLREALGRAAGQPAFFTSEAAPLLADAPTAIKAQLADVSMATVTVGPTGLGVVLGCKPGTANQVLSMAEGGLGMARALVEKKLASLPGDPASRLVEISLRHYSKAFFESLERKVTGDELTISLGWHAPVLPPFQRAPLRDRVIAKEELVVLQLNLGAPILRLWVAMSDVLKAPIDRAALTRELSALMDEQVGTAGFDPSAVTISIGLQGPLFSLRNEPMGPPLAPMAAPRDHAAAAVHMKWGLAATESSKAAELMEAVTHPGKGVAGLEEAKLLASEEAFFRGYMNLAEVEAARAIPAVMTMKSVAMVVDQQGLRIDVVTLPGKAKELVDSLQSVLRALGPAENELYRDRAKQEAGLELMAIMQHQTRETMRQTLTPKSIEGDRVRFETNLDGTQMRLVVTALLVGGAAAVARPMLSTW